MNLLLIIGIIAAVAVAIVVTLMLLNSNKNNGLINNLNVSLEENSLVCNDKKVCNQLNNSIISIKNIETKYNRLERNRNNKNIYKEELSAYDKFKEEEIAKLNNIVEVIQDLLKDKIDLFEYKENNNRTFASFEIKDKLTTKELTFIKGKVNKEVFHLEIDNGNNTKSTIEIHLKNLLEKDLTLEKGNKNV